MHINHPTWPVSCIYQTIQSILTYHAHQPPYLASLLYLSNYPVHPYISCTSTNLLRQSPTSIKLSNPSLHIMHINHPTSPVSYIYQTIQSILTYHAHQPPYLASLLHLSNYPVHPYISGTSTTLLGQSPASIKLSSPSLHIMHINHPTWPVSCIYQTIQSILTYQAHQPPYLASLLHLSNYPVHPYISCTSTTLLGQSLASIKLSSPSLHIRHINHPTWPVSCIYQTIQSILTYHAHQPPYLASLLHLSNYPVHPYISCTSTTLLGQSLASIKLSSPSLHIRHINHPTWPVSCIYQTIQSILTYHAHQPPYLASLLNLSNYPVHPYTSCTSTTLLGQSPASIKLSSLSLHIMHTNHLTWPVSCIYQTIQSILTHHAHQAPYLASLLHLSNYPVCPYISCTPTTLLGQSPASIKLSSPSLHIRHINHPTWTVSCIYQTIQSALTYHTHQPPYLASLLHLSNYQVHPYISCTSTTLLSQSLTSIKLSSPALHIMHINHLTWPVSCIYQTIQSILTHHAHQPPYLASLLHPSNYPVHPYISCTPSTLLGQSPASIKLSSPPLHIMHTNHPTWPVSCIYQTIQSILTYHAHQAPYLASLLHLSNYPVHPYISCTPSTLLGQSLTSIKLSSPSLHIVHINHPTWPVSCIYQTIQSVLTYHAHQAPYLASLLHLSNYQVHPYISCTLTTLLDQSPASIKLSSSPLHIMHINHPTWPVSCIYQTIQSVLTYHAHQAPYLASLLHLSNYQVHPYISCTSTTLLDQSPASIKLSSSPLHIMHINHPT